MLRNGSNHTIVFDLQEGLYAITYKRINDAVVDVQEENVKEQVVEGSYIAQACFDRGTSGKCVN